MILMVRRTKSATLVGNETLSAERTDRKFARSVFRRSLEVDVQCTILRIVVHQFEHGKTRKL